jgi:transposase
MRTSGGNGEPVGLPAVLYLAFELSSTKWKLGFSTGFGQKPRERDILAGDLAALRREIRRAKERFSLPANTDVASCYEAGRDGFWLARFLAAEGVQNVVVDSASIEMNRRFRRAKTDRMDVRKLLRMLMRYMNGEHKVWSVVRVPTVREEDGRQLHRELMTAKRDRARVTNRIGALLTSQGIRIEVRPGVLERLGEVRLWDGSPLPQRLQTRLEREWRKVEGLTQEIRAIEAERRALLRSGDGPAVEKVRQLLQIRGIGTNCAWLYVMEFFGWREFRNRREVGSLAGLSPTPYSSGGMGKERGISKCGNRHVRAMAIEIAWCWLRFQPESSLTRWYQRRFAHGSTRMRRVGIVALARRLLVELWRYLETGALPDGAVLKA